MINFMYEIHKAVYSLLNGFITVGAEQVPVYTTTFEPKEMGVYISSYAERADNLKQHFGATVDLGITCFTKDMPLDTVVDIASQVETVLKPTVNAIFTTGSDCRITVLQRTSKLKFTDLVDGVRTERIEMIFTFLIDE
jgi:F0F1-type ATP synthase epsilon subunit